RRFNHLRRGLQVNGHWLLYEHMLTVSRAQFHCFQPVRRKRAHIHKVNVRPCTKLFRSGHKVATSSFCKRNSLGGSSVGTDGDRETDVLVCLRVFPCNRAGADNSHSHGYSSLMFSALKASGRRSRVPGAHLTSAQRFNRDYASLTASFRSGSTPSNSSRLKSTLRSTNAAAPRNRAASPSMAGTILGGCG